MLTGQELQQAASRSKGLWQCAGDSRFWLRLIRGSRSRHGNPRREAGERQQLLHSEDGGHEAGLHRPRERDGGSGYVQWKNPTLAITLCWFSLAGGFSCSVPVNPPAAFKSAREMFLRGDLQKSQNESEKNAELFKVSQPTWALKFKLLEAESLAWRGMYREVLTLLGPAQPPHLESDLAVPWLAVMAVAQAHLGLFPESNRSLARAESL